MKLSKESAERHYKKLIELHYFEYLTLAQKVIIFEHDLEHDILREITGKNNIFDQLNFLRKYQEKVERGVKSGTIRKVLINDIESLKNWRNEGAHENNMPKPKYKSHFHTMAQTLKFFSEIQWTDEISDICNDKVKPLESPNGLKQSKDEEKNKINSESNINQKKNVAEIIFKPNKKSFIENLIKNQRADYTIIYNDDTESEREWKVIRFDESSDVIGNIRSGPLRGWKAKGIKKAIFRA